MQLCFLHCVEEPNITVTVVGQDVPNLKSGAMKDLRSILNANKHLEKYIKSVNNTDRVYKFHNGSELEFKSYDNEQDARSGKRDYAFFNEANGIPYSVYEQIAIRTKKKVYIDFNPSAEFWAHTMVWKPTIMDEEGNPITDSEGRVVREIPKDKNGKDIAELIKSNWRHNPFLPQEVIDRIERKKNIDPEWYKVYGLGEMGVIEGLVYKRVKTIPQWPHEELADAKVSFGLDFGYSDDPTVLVKTAVKDNVVYVEELIYAYRLKLDKMAMMIRSVTDDGMWPVWADIEPRTIDELKDRGCNIRAVYKKNKDIKAGIELVNSYDEIRVTAKSHNLIREFKNYKYPKKKHGAIADENDDKPIDAHNHGMDSLRYSRMQDKYVGEMKVFTFDINFY
jgi:phage terminase large subunit